MILMKFFNSLILDWNECKQSDKINKLQLLIKQKKTNVNQMQSSTSLKVFKINEIMQTFFCAKLD